MEEKSARVAGKRSMVSCRVESGECKDPECKKWGGPKDELLKLLHYYEIPHAVLVVLKKSGCRKLPRARKMIGLNCQRSIFYTK